MASDADIFRRILKDARSNDSVVLRKAEASIKAAERQPGYGSLLVQLATANNVSGDEKQLSAILLKKFVKSHWDAEAEDFEAPAVSETEKARIRAELPKGLADSDSKIRAAVAMAIASIACTDVPLKWPTLIEDIVGAISSRANPLLVSGSLSCLSMFVEELDEEPLVQVVLLARGLSQLSPLSTSDGAAPAKDVLCLTNLLHYKVPLHREGESLQRYVYRKQSELQGYMKTFALSIFLLKASTENTITPTLLPELLSILKQPALYDSAVRKQAVSIMRRLINNCTEVVGIYKVQAQQIVVPHLPVWLQEFCRTVEASMNQQMSTEDISLLVEVMKTMVALFEKQGKHVQSSTAAVMRSTWELFSACMPLYRQSVLNSIRDEGEVCAESDNEPADLSSLISLLFDLLMVVAGSSKLRESLEQSLPQLIHLTLGYMQISRTQESNWTDDPEDFILEEDEQLTGPRASELAAKALLETLQAWINLANDLKMKGDQQYWKVREAALLAVGSLSLAEMKPEAVKLLHVDAVLQNILDVDLGEQPCHMFLHCRALWATARLAGKAGASWRSPCVQAMTAGLAQGQPAVVQMSACRAIQHLLQEADGPILESQVDSVIMNMGLLVSQFKGEALQTVLSSLQAVLQEDKTASSNWQPSVTPPILTIWATNLHDPLLTLTLLDIFTALASSPQAIMSLQALVIPIVVSIISKPKENAPTIIEGALDLANTLLEAGPPIEALKECQRLLITQVLTLLNNHDDSAVLQSCCEYLRLMIQAGGEEILVVEGNDSTQAVQHILLAMNRLLHLESNESAAIFVGPVVMALLNKVPQQALGNLPIILPAVVSKLVNAKSLPLISGLLAICAQLTLTNAHQFIDYLAKIQDNDGKGSALAVVLQIWTERQAELHGSQEIKLSTAALSTMLATRHQILNCIQVKGKRLDVDTGIRTRSRAKSQAEQWDYVPASTKIFSLLADTLIEANEGADATDEDSWHSESEDNALETNTNWRESLASTKALRSMWPDANSKVHNYLFKEECDTLIDPHLADLDLTQHICSQFKHIAEHDRPLFNSCCQSLNNGQLQAVKACF